MIILSCILLTALIAGLTWWMTRGRTAGFEGYFLAGRNLGMVSIAASLLLTNISTEQIVGLNGAAYKDGLCVMVWEVLSCLSIVVFALYFLPKYLRAGYATVPQFLEARFGKTLSLTVAGVFIVAYALIAMPIILYTGATGLNSILDLASLTGIQDPTANLWIMVAAIGATGAAYTLLGGMRAIAISDTIYGGLLLVGCLAIPIFALVHIQGGPDVGAALATVRRENPEHFKSLGGPETSVPWHTVMSGVFLLTFFYWTTNQQIIQRAFAGRSLREAQKGALLTAGIKLAMPLAVVLPGILAWHLFKNDPNAATQGDASYGMLVRRVLPAPLAGVFAAAIIGAILSSFNGALNSAVTLFGVDLCGGQAHTESSDRRRVLLGKAFGLVIAVVSIALAPWLAKAGGVFNYLQKMNGIYFIPILVVVLAGWLIPKATGRTALPVMVASFALMVAVTLTPLGDALAARGVHGFHAVGLVFALSMALMIALSQCFPGQPPAPAAPAVALDLSPWKHAKWVSAVIIAVLAGMYAVFMR